MGRWFVAVAVLAQTTSSSTTTTTLGGGAGTGTSSSGPSWWVVIGTLALAAASVFAIWYQHGRAAAAVKINTELVDQNKKLQGQVVELETQIEGLGLGQSQAQAQIIKWQEERIDALQQQVMRLDDHTTSLEEQIQRPEIKSTTISNQQSEIVSRLTESVAKLSEENRLLHEQLHREPRRRGGSGTAKPPGPEAS